MLIDIPWNQRLCFLDSPQLRADALNAVRRAVYSCARHPAVFAFSVANEIPPDIVRWHSAERVKAFLHELYDLVKSIAPNVLVSYANFPPTEYLDLAKEAPSHLTWGHYDRSALVRIPLVPTDEHGRLTSPGTIEFRLPDGSASPRSPATSRRRAGRSARRRSGWTRSTPRSRGGSRRAARRR